MLDKQGGLVHFTGSTFIFYDCPFFWKDRERRLAVHAQGSRGYEIQR